MSLQPGKLDFAKYGRAVFNDVCAQICHAHRRQQEPRLVRLSILAFAALNVYVVRVRAAGGVFVSNGETYRFTSITDPITGYPIPVECDRSLRGLETAVRSGEGYDVTVTADDLQKLPDDEPVCADGPECTEMAFRRVGQAVESRVGADEAVTIKIDLTDWYRRLPKPDAHTAVLFYQEHAVREIAARHARGGY